MSKEKITINGQEVGVAYCYATEIAFTKYTGVSVDEFDTKNPEHHIYIILAAIMAYNGSEGIDTTIRDTDLMYNARPAEIIEALRVIFELRAEWYALPAGDPAERSTDKEEDKAKN